MNMGEALKKGKGGMDEHGGSSQKGKRKGGMNEHGGSSQKG